MIERGVFKTTVSTKKLICNKEVILSKGDSKKGVILSYQYNKNSLLGKKNGTLIFDDLFYNDKNSENLLIEMIYFPRFVSVKEKETIESYLSMKYGISLADDKNYYNSKGDTLWNSKNNNHYNKRLTALGRDDAFRLYQKQSQNYLKDGLTIGLNKIENINATNLSTIANNSFLVWADNGKSTLLENSNDTKKIKRIWKISNISDTIQNFNTQIHIDKKIMLLENKSIINNPSEYIWLAIDSTNTSNFNYENASYYKANSETDEELFFDNVKFSSNKNYLFTIVKAPEFSFSKTDAKFLIAKTIDGENLQQGKYFIFPNPVLADNSFTILFNLDKESNVAVEIVDVTGRIIKNKSLGLIKEFSYKESLFVAGTYLFIVTVDGKIETSKIIVK